MHLLDQLLDQFSLTDIIHLAHAGAATVTTQTRQASQYRHWPHDQRGMIDESITI